MPLPILLPDNLEQRLTLYCQQHHLSKNETIRLALEHLFITSGKPLSPYELGKDGFGSDQTHEGDIAEHTKALLKAVGYAVRTFNGNCTHSVPYCYPTLGH